jgi:3-oxoacyl-[acyl-carrier protein] reductase
MTSHPKGGPAGRFAGRAALVTGASRGIGRAIALRLGSEGAAVAVNFAVNRDAAEEVVAALAEAGAEAVALQADVADRGAVAAMVERALQRFGRIDVLVNNAAVVRHGDLASYSEAALYGDLDEMWRVNVLGIVHTTRAVAPGMIARRAGSIVNIASIAGYANASGGTTFYGSTKAAAINLTKRFAFELGPHNVNVNAVAPGLVRTDVLTRGRSPAEIERMAADFAARSMLRRVGEPPDIAGAVAFLASPDASFVTGQILTVDGGRMDYLTFSG